MRNYSIVAYNPIPWSRAHLENPDASEKKFMSWSTQSLASLNPHGEGPAGEQLVGAAGMALTGYKSNSGWFPREEKTGGRKGSGAVLPLLGRRWRSAMAGQLEEKDDESARGKTVHN
jgi:hypothetical protein